MLEFFIKRFSNNKGLSLIEIVTALLISSIAFTGLLVAYTDGVRYVRDYSERSVMYSEGTAALETISRFIRVSSRALIKSYGGNRRTKLELRFPSEIGGRTEFYYVDAVHELRWNDSSENRNKFNMVLIPLMDYRRAPGEDAYIKVKHCEFTPMDFMGVTNPLTQGYGLIKTELVLENVYGDTLYMSNVTAKRNRF